MLEIDAIHCCDVFDGLKQLPDNFVDCVVTSPPYWGLRDYGVTGQFGLEKTPNEYVSRMVDVFHDVKRVLKKDGTVWLNLGDSYARCGGDSSQTGRHWDGRENNPITGSNRYADDIGLKPKDLIGIPWRVAFALQSDGWWLRQDIIWAKPNPMPESVTDRCTKSHEYVFLLTKSKDYYYDAEAIKEPNQSSYTGGDRIDRETPNIKGLRRCPDVYNPSGRNKRSVWTITTKPFKDSHFATFPLDLVEPMILAGTSERGVCPDCGKPWERIVERDNPSKEFMEKDARVLASAPDSYSSRQCVKSLHRNTGGVYSNAKTLGWKPSCKCDKDPIPALVLDPFCGSGTACLVAKKLNRHYIGFEINPEYVKMANNSIISNRDIQIMHTLKLVDNGLQKKLEWN